MDRDTDTASEQPRDPRFSSSVKGSGDTHLVLRAQDGDVEAFERLVLRYQGRMFRAAYFVVGNRQDAEDVVQDSLILAWRRLHLLREPEAFRGWLLRICTNEATSAVRRQSRRGTNPHEMETLETLTSTGDASHVNNALSSGTAPTNPARSCEVNAQMEALKNILAELNSDLRIVWVFREVDGMAYEEIADTLNLTPSTVRGRLSRARSIVMEKMEEWA